ncbi:Mu transposase domain-containing protein [Streptomyces canus]|uniref:Mu transposase domain-containing protein n=1 Tax=Streptomyces canus TaxID=58343 RepID=UPI002B1CF8BC|nr:hypothetical protein [Streptomyces canus]
MTFEPRVDRCGRITVKMCSYSVPVRFIDRKVTVHLTGDMLVVFEIRREIGWMMFPEFQGRSLGKRAVRPLLQQAWSTDRWGDIHALPVTTHGPSNRYLTLTGLSSAR